MEQMCVYILAFTEGHCTQQISLIKPAKVSLVTMDRSLDFYPVAGSLNYLFTHDQSFLKYVSFNLTITVWLIQFDIGPEN